MDKPEFDLAAAVRVARSFAESTGIGCVVLDRHSRVRYPEERDHYPCLLCRGVAATSTDLDNTAGKHWQWVEQAARFGGQYVFLCENTFTHWTTPIMVDGRIVGALVAGPVLTIDDERFFETEILPRAAGGEDIDALRGLFDEVPRVAPSRVTALSDLLYLVGSSISSESRASLDQVAAELEIQSRISEFVQELKRRRIDSGQDPDSPSYPLATEQKLLHAIRMGDVTGAPQLLNELLGHVFFAAGSDLPSIKYRTRELVVLLSRAAIEEGADPEQIFGLNYQFVDTLERQEDINRVAYWMSRIVRRFAELVLYLPNVAHAAVLRKAIAYVRHHLDEPMRVGDIAKHVGLSQSYFSRLFHQEMRETFVEYVNRARIDRARDLLRTGDLPVTEIASQVGFADHSYFTKVFREAVGTTPSGFRSSG